MSILNPLFTARPSLSCIFALALGVCAHADGAEEVSVGIFDHHEDIGAPTRPGSAEYDPENQQYRISAAGKSAGDGEDPFQLLWKKVEGDFILRATVRFIGEEQPAHRKLGIMIREELKEGARQVSGTVHGDTLTSLQYRDQPSGDTSEKVVSAYHPTEIALERKGDTFIFSAATFGQDYQTVSYEMELANEAFTGLFVSSQEEAVMQEALFSNVRLVRPVQEDYVPYRDYIGSHIEVMDVQTGHRRIVHSENRSLQAPNWTTDGKTLIYNSADGLMHRYDFSSDTTEPLNTGFATSNNNDHVISFDGEQLAISHYYGEDRISTIYTLPVGGSDNPKRITSPENGHSFLHSWSPDGTELLFTGHRNGQYDIWGVDISSGKERQLTNEPTLDDGSEYTPDGEWVYFNSVRTGTMQIWRMRPDGSDQEQVTFDASNDWFPHISPDGQWLVYLAYPADMDPTTHPFYKRVYLKLMPTSGGAAKTIGYVYGGQGSINTHSWSPDSRYIAFVSNTRM